MYGLTEINILQRKRVGYIYFDVTQKWFEHS